MDTVWILIATAATNVVTWGLTKNQNKVQIAKLRAEATGQEIENYRGMIEDMKSLAEYWKTEAQEFQTRLKDSMKAVDALEYELKKLKKELAEANKKIDKLEKINNDKIS